MNGCKNSNPSKKWPETIPKTSPACAYCPNNFFSGKTATGWPRQSRLAANSI